MAVARLWADRLESGKIDNFNKVPAKLQDAVRSLLEEDGYEIMEDGSVIPINDDDEDSEDVDPE